jgi:hypothetical protein
MTSRFLAWPLAAVAAVAAISLPAARAPAADGPRALAPSGDWTLSSDAESCTIARQFGATADGVSFRLRAFAPGGRYRLVLYGPAMPQRDSGLLQFEYSFEPDPGTISATGVLSKVSGTTMVSFLPTFDTSAVAALDPSERARRGPLEAMARAASINDFVITFSRGRPLALPLGSLTEPLAQLDACAQDLPRNWGLDPAVQRSLQRPAMPIGQEGWLGPGTYPWHFLRTGQSMIVNLRMVVDASGAPTECVVQAPKTQSGAEALTCREILKAARFEPALDSSGNAVSSYFATTIFYATPRRNGPTSRGGTIAGGP